MGLRVNRRVHLAPGLRLNLSKRGVSVSVGHRGAWYTTGPAGRRATVGIPGSGVYYTRHLGGASTPKPAPSAIRTLLVLAVVIFFAVAAYQGITAAGAGRP